MRECAINNTAKTCVTYYLYLIFQTTKPACFKSSQLKSLTQFQIQEFVCLFVFCWGEKQQKEATQMEHTANASQEALRDLFIAQMESELAGQQRILFILMMPIRGKTEEKTEMQPDGNHPFSVGDWEIFHYLQHEYVNCCFLRLMSICSFFFFSWKPSILLDF